MKRKYGISLKLTLFVLLIVGVIVTSIVYLNIQRERDFFEKAYFEKADLLATSLKNGICNYQQLEDREWLYTYLLRFIYLYSGKDVVVANINLMENNELLVVASTDYEKVGSSVSDDNYDSYRTGEAIARYTNGKDGYFLRLIEPLDLSGQRVGTIEIVVSMNKAYKQLDTAIINSIAIAATISLIFVAIFIYVLKKLFITPVLDLKNAALKVAEGDLNVKVDFHLNDEIGDLSSAFNTMVKELKRSKDKIEEYSKNLEKMLKQREEFMRQLGHDLKTPLTPLNVLLPVVKEKIKDKKLREFIDTAIRNVNYIKNLVNRTLQLEYLNVIKEIEIEEINLSKEVNSIIADNAKFKDKNIAIRNTIPKHIIVKADKLRLRELFDNLITNAIKYSPNGGTITIGAKKIDGMVKVFVKDTGIGLTEEQKKKVFDEFYKADESRHDFNSTGLGLTICKRIVEKHGGKIWVESKGLGKGSTFYFTLKAADKKINK